MPDESAGGYSYTIDSVTECVRLRVVLIDIYGNEFFRELEASPASGLKASAVDHYIYIAHGGSARMEVIASAEVGEISYQWCCWWDPIDGETDPVLEVTDQRYTYEYQCQVSDIYGKIITVNFYVIIDNGLRAVPQTGTVTGRTATVNREPGKPVELKVAVYANDLDTVSYDWHDPMNGTTLSSGSDTFVLDNEDIDYVTCSVRDVYGNEAYVEFYIRTVQTALACNPVKYRVTALYGQPAVMETIVVRSNGAVSYQWYKDDGSANGQIIAGATDSSYTVPSVTETGNYHCVVTDASGQSCSVSFLAAVDNSFSVMGPETIYVMPGEAFELFTEAFAANGELTYQWYWNYVLVEGAVNATLAVDGVGEKTVFICSVRDIYGNVGSKQFTVVTGPKITISDMTVDPGVLRYKSLSYLEASYEARPGTTATLSITAACDGADLTYQWASGNYDTYGNEYWTDIEGATESSWSVFVSGDDYGFYRCAVSNGYQTVYATYYLIITDQGSGELIRFIGAQEDEYGDTVYRVAPGERAAIEVELLSDDIVSCEINTWGDGAEYISAYETRLVTPKVWHSIRGCVYVIDKDGVTHYYYFTVEPDNGLSLIIDPDMGGEGGESRRTLYVPYGGSVDLKVIGSVQSGNIEYQWTFDYGTCVTEQIADNILRINNVVDMVSVTASAVDEYGNRSYVYFNVCLQNTLTAAPDNGLTTVYVVRGEDAYVKFDINCEHGSYNFQSVALSYSYNSSDSPNQQAVLIYRNVTEQIADTIRVRDSYSNAVTIKLTIVPVDEEDSSNVTFDSDGGSYVFDQTVPEGEAAGQPSDPEKPGYVFMGWTLNGEAYDFDQPVTGDIKLVAVWASYADVSPAYSATVTMNENFNLNLYVKDLPQQFAQGFTVRWTFDGKSYEKNLGELTPQTGGQYPGSFKVALATVFSYEMTKPFVIKVYRDGTEAPIKEITYSVQQYFQNQYNKTSDALFKKIYGAALDYGASAQLYFNGQTNPSTGQPYDTDAGNLANKTTNPNFTITATKPTNKASKSGSITGMDDKMTATLIFGSETSIKIYFTYSGDINGMTITADNGKTVTAPELGSDGRYSVKIEGIRSFELYKDFTFTFKVGTGANAQTRTVTYSAYAYAASKWDNSNANLARLVKALVAYGELARQKWQ